MQLPPVCDRGEPASLVVWKPLTKRGLLEAVKAKAISAQGWGQVCNGRKNMRFQLLINQSTRNGWQWTWQVPRADFDKTLADECERMGVSINYETGSNWQ